MATTLKQLNQLRPANTTAASLYSTSVGVNAVVKSLIICNTSGSAAKARVFHDDDGTTYDETTALAWDINVPADTTVSLELFIAMEDDDGNLAVRTNAANALTFTAYGSEQT